MNNSIDAIKVSTNNTLVNEDIKDGKSMFYYIHIWMLITVVVTLLTSLVVKVPLDRYIILMEAVISGISTTIYYLLDQKIVLNEKNNEEIDWKGITVLRYNGWMFSTPIMIIAFLLFLSSNSKIKLTIRTSITIILLDWLMLYLGYLGEIGTMDRNIAVVTGFIPLLIIFGIIYHIFLRNKYIFINYVMFAFFIIFWSLYGVGYVWELEPRNYLMNWLDLLSKSGFGLVFAFYFLYKRYK